MSLVGGMMRRSQTFVCLGLYLLSYTIRALFMLYPPFYLQPITVSTFYEPSAFFLLEIG